MGSYLGGVHIELTGEDVTECTGGARGLTDADLQRAYRSTVDPRLNHEQALELAMLIAEHSQTRRADKRAATQPARLRNAVRAHHRVRGRRRRSGSIRTHSINVPDEPIIPFIEGDGIGIDVTPAMHQGGGCRRGEGLRRQGAASTGWRSTRGTRPTQRLRPWLPDETLQALREFVVSIKGPLGRRSAAACAR